MSPSGPRDAMRTGWQHMPDIREFLIQRRRETLMITQMQLAERMETSQSALSDLETGVIIDPRLSTLARWAQALGLDMMVQLVEREPPQS